MTTTRRTLSAAATVLLAVTSMLVTASGTSGAQPSSWRYTMVAFSNTSDRAMDVYESSDATNFEPVQRPAYQPPSGLVRDPSIFLHSDGFYHVTYTTGGGADIGFARSPDRVNWTQMGNYPVPFCCFLMPGTGDGKGPVNPLISGSAGFRDGPTLSPFTTKAWAPEWFVEGDRVNIILSMSTGGGFVPYVMTALDPSLKLWSMPVPLAGLGADRIDTTVVKVGSVYHAFTKNETKKVIEHATAPSLTGPYTFVAAGEDWGALREGPAVTRLPNGDWRIYFDAYTENKYFYSDSSDGLRTWSQAKELPGLSGDVRHFSVMQEPA